MPDSEKRRRSAFAAGLLAGVSALALAGGAFAAGSTAPRFEFVAPDLTVQLADSGEGGESGESGELGDSDEIQPYLIQLLTMKGHLLVAGELHAADDALLREQSRMHFGHPSADEVAAIEPMLDEYGGGELGEAVEELQAALAADGEGGEAGDYDDAYEEAIDALDEAIEGAYDAIDAPLAEAVAASLSVLRHAAGDYEKSFANGRIADAHEYQDGRGFYLAVRDDIDGHANALAAHNPEKLAELMAALDEAGRAWPTVELPATASISPQELNAALARFEIAALAFR